ncbi:NAD(+) diphosphatase [Litorihabitans aurantiacus]|uniref:NAD(+) diphosphatase n=1 Tax=Litorihabitans aurantiacus TaxID=1930061 RepID=A0AA38CRS5_9MICO|nr:NAD(+) diphosphatase [Litorihabitans aurantiacus]GMA32126.1 hypothetical protein GCM10025875_21180 [Litorihabitans aurantiacus]
MTTLPPAAGAPDTPAVTSDGVALPLGRSAIDRDADRRREEGLIERLRADSSTAVVVVASGHVRVGDGTSLDLRAPDAVAGPGSWFYLGHDGERAYLAHAPEPAPRFERGSTTPGWASLRDVGHLLSDAEAGLATAAVALASWRRGHRHCPRCGASTVLVEAGWAARCERDGSTHYPRTDPAVIMSVRDGADRLLLARSAAWPQRRRSVLAGFVEAGEGLEQAVRREVAEEVGLAVGHVDYLGAQPWPFPGSLMVAFHGYLDGEAHPGGSAHPRPDGVEILDADFYTREALARIVGSGEVVLPSRTSIARVIIESWYGGALPG